MRKLTECLIVLAVLLCAFTAQAASEVDVSVPSAGQPCSNDLECDTGEICINNICSVARPCTGDLQCDTGEICLDNICRQGECQTDEDCDEGLLCLALQCVECRTWKDCDNETEICSDKNTCVLAADCDLKTKGKMIINKDKKTDYQVAKIRIKGNENFYPFKPDPLFPENMIPDFDISPLFQTTTKARWYLEKRAYEIAAGCNTDVPSGIYTVRLGKCLGEIEVVNKKQ